jgi:hypothetical protein
MRTVRNITVAVEPELYRQTRKIAADYDTTVTDMVRFLLMILPEAVKAARYPGGCPQFGLAAARAAASAPPALLLRPRPQPFQPRPGKKQKFVLYACKCHSTTLYSVTCKATSAAHTG